jgi:predicted metalloprotease
MHIGIGGMIIILILSFVFKRNFFTLLSGGGGTSSAASEPDHARDAKEDPTVKFVSFVLDDAQQTWAGILQQQGIPYRHAKLVLFRDATASGCGSARSATGPFYCPTDEKVYIDLGFYDELKRRFGAPGDFAQAYVLAHELGHHVQKLIGVEQKVRALQHSNPGGTKSVIGEAGIAGRLPGRSLGALDRSAQTSGKRRRGECHERRSGRRRRPFAKNVDRPGQSGILYPRQFGPAYAMV